MTRRCNYRAVIRSDQLTVSKNVNWIELTRYLEASWYNSGMQWSSAILTARIGRPAAAGRRKEMQASRSETIWNLSENLISGATVVEARQPSLKS